MGSLNIGEALFSSTRAHNAKLSSGLLHLPVRCLFVLSVIHASMVSVAKIRLRFADPMFEGLKP